MNTLRNRLLASYVAILLIMLGLIGFVLMVFLATRPLPTDALVNQMTATLLDVRLVEVLRDEIQADGGQSLVFREVYQQFNVDPIQVRPGGQSGQDGNQGNPNNLNNQDDTVYAAVLMVLVDEYMVPFLTEQATGRDVRTLIISNDRRVVFDSADSFDAGSLMHELERHPLTLNHRFPITNQLQQGRFVDVDGDEWLFVTQPVRPLGQNRPETLYLMVAEPVPRPSLGQVMDLFGDEFLVPLAQAGLIGLVLAIGLALLISGSVARPLGRMSRAAGRMAEGDYSQRVRVDGPREVRALASSFNNMAARVEATTQAQRDFMANVSHDLRTPLTSIQGFSQAIAEGVASDPASAQRAAQIIHDEAGRLHRMVESLMEMARIQAGTVDMQQHAVAIGDLLQGIGESLIFKAREKGLTLEIDLPPDLPRLAADGDRLAQVFTNLLDNAIKHTYAGTITLRAQVDMQGVLVSVRDTGEGIPPEDVPRVFERFYQVDKSRQSDRRSGMGLGLAITKQIVEAHGGAIQVASEMGVGTVFSVWLPRPTADMTTVITLRR